MQSVLQNLETTFEGKESEHNWSKRLEACRDVIPTLCQSDAAKENAARLASGIRHVIDGLMTCAISERTQLSNAGCKALQEVSQAIGPNIHSMIDIILPQLIDVCGFTKQVSQEHGSETVEAIVRNSGYHSRILNYIISTSSDKRTPPRVAAAKWLKVSIATYHRDIEKVTTNLDTIERGIATGLGDKQKDVREAMRVTYWIFFKYWSARAEGLMNTLPKAAQTALIADENNPNRHVTQAQTQVPAARKKAEETRAFILAQKKKKIAQARQGYASASIATAAAKETPLEVPQTLVAKGRDSTVDTEHSSTPASAPGHQRMASGLLAEPARRRIQVAMGSRPPPAPRPASSVPSVVSTQSTSTPTSRPTSTSSSIAPPIIPVPMGRPTSAASSAAVSHASTVTQKPASRKPPISKESELMTKPIDGVEEDNKENDAAHSLVDKREWARKETAESSQRSIMPLTKDPVAARILIARGIKSINDGTIDEVGYRKLQGLIKDHDNIFFDEPKYDDMLLALFDAIEKADNGSRRPLGRKHDSNFQMLVVIRLMFQHHRKYFSTYYPRAMTALITARGNFESRSHIVSGLEQTAEDIVKVCTPSDVVDAVLMILELAGKPDSMRQDVVPQNDYEQGLLNERGARSTAMGLHVLSGLIARGQQLSLELGVHQEERLAALGMHCLRSSHVSVKRAVIEYSVKLHEVIHPESRYYDLLTDGVESLQNLIAYYVTASHSETSAIAAV